MCKDLSRMETKTHTALRLALFHSASTQKAVAERAGISESQLSKIASGQRHASPDVQVAIAKALNLDVADVFGMEQAA